MSKSFRFVSKNTSSSVTESDTTIHDAADQPSEQNDNIDAGTNLAAHTNEGQDHVDDLQNEGVGIFPESEVGFYAQPHTSPPVHAIGNMDKNECAVPNQNAQSDDEASQQAAGISRAVYKDPADSDPCNTSEAENSRAQGGHEVSTKESVRPAGHDTQWDMKREVSGMTGLLASHMPKTDSRTVIQNRTLQHHEAILDDVHEVFELSGMTKTAEKMRLPWRKTDEHRFRIMDGKTDAEKRPSLYMQSVRPTVKSVKAVHPAVAASLAALERLKRMVCMYVCMYVCVVCVCVYVCPYARVHLAAHWRA
jgi:hypothetical protein